MKVPYPAVVFLGKITVPTHHDATPIHLVHVE